ncbi:MAG: alpha/beta hydrolase [Myxococcota bacterium]
MALDPRRDADQGVPMATADVGRGIHLEYETSGEGPPLVLIMGIGAQLIWWPSGFVERLARRYRVIVFDNRDVGLSTKLEGAEPPPVGRMIARALAGAEVGAPYSLVDMADDTAGLLDHLGLDDAHVLGVSMGGMVAQALAVAHPHRVRTLTSIMSHPGGRRYIPRRPRALRALLAPRPRDRDEAVARTLAFYDAVGSSGFARDIEGIRERAAEAYERCDYPAGFLRHFAAICGARSRRGALRFVRCPSAVIHGTVDPLVPPLGGRDTHANLPDATLHLIEGMGHDLPPGAWNHVIEAIDAVTARVS